MEGLRYVLTETDLRASNASTLLATMPFHRRMPELVFEVVQEADGGYCAEYLTENIFTDLWATLVRHGSEVGQLPRVCSRAFASFSSCRNGDKRPKRVIHRLRVWKSLN